MRQSDEMDGNESVPESQSVSGGLGGMGIGIAIGCGLLILAGVGVAVFGMRQATVQLQAARNAEVQAILEAGAKRLEAAARNYHEKNGRYPKSVQEIVDMDPGTYGSLNNLTDPWGNPFELVLRDGKLFIHSNGADGLPGGVDTDLDFQYEVKQ